MANAAIFNALMRPVRSVDDYLTQYDQRDAQKAQIQQNALAAMQGQQLREMQMAEMQRRSQAEQMAQQQAQQQAEARRAALLRAGPVTGIQANAASGMTGPTPQAAAAIGQRRQINASELLAAGVPIEQIKLLAEADTLGKPKVSRQIEVDDGKGGKRIALVDDYGNEVAGMAGYVAPVQVNQGNQITFARPQAGVSLPVGMSPSERDSSARGWAGIGIQRQAETRQAEAAKLAAAGGGKQGPMSVTLQKELLESDDVAQSSAAVVGTLTQAKAINDKAYSGYLAKPRATLRSNLPGESPSADATINLDNMMTGQALESLKVTFGAAPTEGERKILMDMQASADKTPAQRKDIIDRAIAAAKRRGEYAARKAEAIRSGKYLSEGIPQVESPSAAPAGAGPAVGAVVDGYKFKGGDPSKQSSWEKQ